MQKEKLLLSLQNIGGSLKKEYIDILAPDKRDYINISQSTMLVGPPYRIKRLETNG